MRNHSNPSGNAASNGLRIATVSHVHTPGIDNRGEVTMNRIQKAVIAVVALTVTLLGAVLVTAPMALADMQPVAAHYAISGTR